jgi:hypothetical protein
MRLSLLTTALLAFATACVHGQPPRPLVVLVHGRGHLEDDTTMLRREWKRHLDTALARAGAAPLPDADVRLAWYADIMDPSRDVRCGRGIGERSDSLGGETFVRDFLASLAAALPSGQSGGARTILGDMLYALDGSRRCAAEERVQSVMARAIEEKRPVVLVAYSLGALVTYGVLDDARVLRESRVALVTLGSPLGDDDIRALLGSAPDSLRIPPGVVHWENVYDPGDVFASPIADIVKGARDAELSTRGSDAVEAHYVDRYLTDRVTGEALARALCAVSGRAETACVAARK